MGTPQISSPSVWTSISDPWSSQQVCGNDDPSPYSSPFLGLSDFDNMSDHASSTSSSAHVIRVAIIGGSLGSACLLRGLLRYPHIAADLYDARPQFRDEGPALDLSEAHQEVLRALDPALDACLDRAGAVYSSVALCVGTATTAHRGIDVSGLPIPGRRTVSRQALMDEILADVPPYLLHTNTHIASVSGTSETDGGGGAAFLEFVDGTRRRYDVPGAVVRGFRARVGPDFNRDWGKGSGAQARLRGKLDPPLQVPLARAQQAMGPAYLDPQSPCRAGWIGDGIFMQHDFLNHGRDIQISLSALLPPPPVDSRRGSNPGGPAAAGPAWAKLFTPEEFEATFAQNKSPVCQGMVKLVQSVYTIQIAGIVQMQHVPTQTYARRRVCLLGGAAHAASPYHGASASLSLEQAMVLSTLLGYSASSGVGIRGFTKSGHDVEASLPYYALQAYDAVCRPRADQVVEATSDVMNTLLGRGSGGLSRDFDPVSIAERLRQRWPAVHNLHVVGLQNAAVDTMEQFIAEDSKW
ncbi:3-hydroxybenzoate 6-hydroxylase [Apiospora hydei]|uniref:3-hydroxybenzoate 6-hydroxylase n=1 Tax=Apiospora hydei TaxID=1337664 RepID=A0ABR1VLG9_9PEZI